VHIPYGGNEILLNAYEVLQDDLPMTSSTLNDNEWSYIIGGWEAGYTPLLRLCIANYNGSAQPGKYLFADGTCHFSYTGVEKLTYDYSFLRVRATSFIYPPPAFDFVVGQDTNGEPLYACWATIDADNNTSLQLGKYRRDFGNDGCHVSWGGQEWFGHTASADTQDDLEE